MEYEIEDRTIEPDTNPSLTSEARAGDTTLSPYHARVRERKAMDIPEESDRS